METKKLFIPSRINVGFQKRKDTYTGMLAYVIYYDQKGVLRKETSWQSWRDDKIQPIEYDNVPTEGFVLNKGVGGARQSYGWNTRNEYIRIYDPRNFEFEISVANLLFILRECNCSKGKGLEGKFVYAWDGTELVLLPESSKDYSDSTNYTKLQSQKIKAKELIRGATYINKKQESLVYIGRFDIYNPETDKKPVDKKYVFINHIHMYPDKPPKFTFLNDVSSISMLVSDTIIHNYAELVDYFNKSVYGSKIAEIKLIPYKKVDWSTYWYHQESPMSFLKCSEHDMYIGYSSQRVHCTYIHSRITLNNGVLSQCKINANSFKDRYDANRVRDSSYSSYSKHDAFDTYIPNTYKTLSITLENGLKCLLNHNSLIEDKDNGESND
jgi:hypothetical protein